MPQIHCLILQPMFLCTSKTRDLFVMLFQKCYFALKPNIKLCLDFFRIDFIVKLVPEKGQTLIMALDFRYCIFQFEAYHSWSRILNSQSVAVKKGWCHSYPLRIVGSLFPSSLSQFLPTNPTINYVKITSSEKRKETLC